MMKKILFLGLIILLGCSKNQKESLVEEKAVVNELPQMQITLTDGKTIEAKHLKGKSILILFQPDCDHCQVEAQQMEENLVSFRDHEVYFVSSSSSEEIKKFANDYKLAGIPNMHFGQTTRESVLDNFGPIPAPSIYIYSPTGKLVIKFNGQTDIGEIMKYL